MKVFFRRGLCPSIAGFTTAQNFFLQLAALALLVLLTFSAFTGRAIRRERTFLTCQELLAAAAVNQPPPNRFRDLATVPSARDAEALRRLLDAAQQVSAAGVAAKANDVPERGGAPVDLAALSSAIAAVQVDQVVLLIVDAMTPRAALGPYASTAGLQRTGNSTTGANSAQGEWFRQIRSELQRYADTGAALARYRVPSNMHTTGGMDDDNDGDVVVAAASLGLLAVADAPTVTTQRLRGLTTGTIPALLEISSTFNAAAVEEDNLIAQVARRGDYHGALNSEPTTDARRGSQRASILGDDTWVRLFPNRSLWSYAAGYESLDIQDLESVDNGVLQHLRRALRWPPHEAPALRSPHPKTPDSATASSATCNDDRCDDGGTSASAALLDRFQQLQRETTDATAAVEDSQLPRGFGPEASVRGAQAVWAEDAWYQVDADLEPPQVPLSLRRHLPPFGGSRSNPSRRRRGGHDGSRGSQQQAVQMATQGPSRLVVAHMLGVDHAGHAHDATDPHLHSKVRHHDAVLREIERTIIERTTAAARGECAPVLATSTAPRTTNAAGSKHDSDDGQAPTERGGCEAYPRKTLLMVMGDHGMSPSGDHGGGTEAETDTFVFARVFAPIVRRRDGLEGPKDEAAVPPRFTRRHIVDGAADARASAALSAAAHYSNTVRRAQCRQTRLCRITDGPEAAVAYAGRQNMALLRNGSRRPDGGEDHGDKGGGSDRGTLTGVDQIDLTSTLALLLGVPIPFANMGHVIPELLALSASFPAQRDEDGAAEADDALVRAETGVFDEVVAAANLCNAHQLLRLDSAALPVVADLIKAITAAVEAVQRTTTATTTTGPSPEGDPSVLLSSPWISKGSGSLVPMREVALNLDVLITARIAAARQSLVATNHAGVAVSLIGLALLVVFFVLPWLATAEGPTNVTSVTQITLFDVLRVIAMAFAVVRAHVAFGNSCIMREDVAMVLLALCAVVVAAHVAAIADSAGDDNAATSSASPAPPVHSLERAASDKAAWAGDLRQRQSTWASATPVATTPRLLPRLRFLAPVLLLALCVRIGVHLGRRTRDFDSNAIVPFPPAIAARRAVAGCLGVVQDSLGENGPAGAWAAASGCANVALAALLDRPLSGVLAATVGRAAHTEDAAAGVPSDHVHFGLHGAEADHHHHHFDGPPDAPSYRSGALEAAQGDTFGPMAFAANVHAALIEGVESAAHFVMHCLVLLTAAISPPPSNADAASRSNGLVGAAVRYVCDSVSALIIGAVMPLLYSVVAVGFIWTFVTRVVAVAWAFRAQIGSRRLDSLPVAAAFSRHALLAALGKSRLSGRRTRRLAGLFSPPAAALLVCLFVLGNATTRIALVAQCLFLVLFFRRFNPLSAAARSSSVSSVCSSSALPNGDRSDPGLSSPGLLWQAVGLHCATWAFFFASGLQASLSSVDWSLPSYWLPYTDSAGGAHTALMLSHVARPFIITELFLCVHHQRAIAGAAAGGPPIQTPRQSAVWTTRLRGAGAALHALVTALVGVGAWLHADHLMVAEVYFPRLAFQLILTVCQCAATALLPLLA